MATSVFDSAVPTDEYVAVQQGSTVKYLLKKTSIGRRKALKAINFVQSQGSTNSVFSGSGNVNLQFLLPIGVSNYLSFCSDMTLEFLIINNSSSAAAALLPVACWIQKIDVLIGSTFETIYPEHLIIDRLFFQENDGVGIEAYQTMENFLYNTSGYQVSASTLAASTSQRYFLRLDNLITKMGVFLPAVNQQISFQVYFQQAAWTTTSSSTTISMQEAKLYMLGYRLEPSVQARLLARYSSAPHYLLYCAQPQQTIVNSENLSSSVKSNTRVNTFSGKQVVAAFIMLKADNSVQQNIISFAAISQLDMKNGGVSVYSNDLFVQEYQHMALETFKTTAPVYTNIVYLPHAVDGYQTLMYNINTGSLEYNSNIVLEILPAATATKSVFINAYTLVQYMISNGIMEKQDL